MRHDKLLKQIDVYLAESGLSEHRFGILAVSNGRLVERLRAGRRVWPETEERILMFLAERTSTQTSGDAA